MIVHRALRWGSLFTFFLSLWGCGDLGEKYPKIVTVTQTTFGDIEYAQLNKLLSTYVKDDGRIDYVAWRKNSADSNSLKDLFLKMTLTDIKKWKPEDQKAFYLNAHNINVLWLVIWQYNTTNSGTNVVKFRSIQNLAKKGQSKFNEFVTKIGQQALSLQAVREQVLAPLGDPRIHLALFLASKGSPPLPRVAFRGTTIEAQLDKIAKDFVNGSSTTLNQTFLDTSKKRIVTSEILKWYKADFEKVYGSLNGFFAKYSSKNTDRFEILFREFDWALNEPEAAEKNPINPEDKEGFWKRLAKKFKKITRFIKCDIIGRIFKVCDKTVVDPMMDLDATESMLNEDTENDIGSEENPN